MSTVCLHENATIDQLCDRRNIVLLCIMFDLCQKGLYMKKSVRFTCATDGYNLDLAIPRLGLYAKLYGSKHVEWTTSEHSKYKQEGTI